MTSSTQLSDCHVATHALLSVKPKYADSILAGVKRYEFRRVIFARPVAVVLVYATVPRARVVGEFDVEGVVMDSPQQLWSLTRDNAGIDECAFFEYFEGAKKGYAIQIGQVRHYPTPFCPVEVLNMRPPQSFA